MSKVLDEKDLSQYRKYIKEKLMALASVLAHVPAQNFPENIRASVKDGDLVTLYNGVQGMVEATYETLEQKIEALCRDNEALQKQVTELAQIKTELPRLKEADAEIRQQNAYLTGLQETALELMNCLETTQVLETVLHRASALLDAPHAYICLLTGEHLEIKAGSGIYSHWIGSQKKPGEGVAGKVWQSGLPLMVNDYPAWPDRELNLEGDEICTVLGVPLKAGLEVIGVLGLAYEMPGRPAWSATASPSGD